MIVDIRTGDVIQGPERHVAFAVNSLGINTNGLAGDIADRFWPEIEDMGRVRMGEMLSKDCGQKVFHALVVHAPGSEGGWSEAPLHIETCLNRLEVPDDELIASVAMGAGMVGMMTGANPGANLAAMARSEKKIVVYDLA